MNELYHHGVKGMHWGVRRYQNEDGSYNAAGKKRYGIGDKTINAYDKAQNHITKIAGGKNNRATTYASQAVARTWASKNPTTLQKALYTAHVGRILKKDLASNREKMSINDSDTLITKKVKTDYNNLSDLEFRAKYKNSKDKYAKRVAKARTGDPLQTGRMVAIGVLNGAYMNKKISDLK